MSLAPPSKKRPTWKAPTTVLPKAKVSGSSSVACWLVVLVNGSELTLVNATFPGALAAGNSTPAATRVMTAPARTTSLVAILPTYASQRGLHRGGTSPRSACWRPIAVWLPVLEGATAATGDLAVKRAWPDVAIAERRIAALASKQAPGRCGHGRRIRFDPRRFAMSRTQSSESYRRWLPIL